MFDSNTLYPTSESVVDSAADSGRPHHLALLSTIYGLQVGSDFENSILHRKL